MTNMIKGKILFGEDELKKLSYVRRSIENNVGSQKPKKEYKFKKGWIKCVGYALVGREPSAYKNVNLNTWEVYTIRNTDWPYCNKYYHKIVNVSPTGWNTDINGEGCTPTEAITIQEMRDRIQASIDGKKINQNNRFPAILEK